ncbi:MAG: hypothetical protein R2795_11740 [Saprospiraceae bacterium]
MMLIWLTMTISWYGIFVERVYEQTQKHLSIIKFSEFIKRNFWEVLLAGNLISSSRNSPDMTAMKSEKTGRVTSNCYI